MTAPSDGELRDDDLANRAVPHMSQSEFSVEIPGQFFVEINTPQHSPGCVAQ
jgi:hypothetical protein